MANSGNDGSGPIDLVPDEMEDTGQQVDTAMYIAAAALGSVVLPKGISSAKAAFIEASANFTQKLDTHGLTIGGFGGGPLDEKTREERRRQSDAEYIDYMTSVIEIGEERMEREREEWATATHEFAGQKLTGQEWANISAELAPGGEGRQWLIDYLMKRGQTPEQAQATADDMKLATSGMSKPKADRTSEETAAIKRIDGNPDSADIMDHYQRARADGFPPVSENTAIFTNTKTTASVTNGADALDDPFPSAPDLTGNYRLAVAAGTVPSSASPSPSQPPPPAPTPPASAGLDI